MCHIKAYLPSALKREKTATFDTNYPIKVAFETHFPKEKQFEWLKI